MDSIEKYDLVIVGGGINGAALARLAAANRLKVLLVEKHDLARGASSASSKLIHGGLRYLEQGHIPLITESVKERALLCKTAPHLVEPKAFYFPITPYNRHPKFILRMGLWMYKNLSKKYPLPVEAKNQSAKEFAQTEPLFLPKAQKGALAYLDCQMDDARLVIENARQASEWGAEVKTYTEYLGRKDNKIQLRDRLTQEDFEVEAPKIALCTGAWTDVQMQAEGRAPVLLQSQGSHLLVDNLPVQSPMILPVPGSKRIFFVLPWLGKTLVGTTESKAPQHPDLCKPQEAEVQELSSLIGRYFPDSKPKGICAFAGIRPLARTGKINSIKASREHKNIRLDDQLYSLIGGKYTTHRTMVEEFYLFMGFDLKKSLESEPLPGAIEFKDHQDVFSSLELMHPRAPKETLERWTKTYGTLALRIQCNNAGGLCNEVTLLEAELTMAIREEFCRTPIDFLRRRSNLFFSADAGLENFDMIAGKFPAPPQGDWKEHYYTLLEDSLHVALKNSPPRKH